MHASIIVTTYNWPSALQIVLESLAAQNCKRFEVLVADDGSTEETAQVVKSFEHKMPIAHIWQSDEGFRAARIRNLAIKQAKYPYVIFIDGDCVLPSGFVQTHLDLARPGYFTAGNRVLLSENITKKILTHQIQIFRWSLAYWHFLKYKGDINRPSSLWKLPLGMFRRLPLKRWQGAKTCHLAVFTEDLFSVGGFDESFVGWGYEDSDLVVRLLKLGRCRQSAKWATTVWHLWHKEACRDKADENYQKFIDRIHHSGIKAAQGI